MASADDPFSVVIFGASGDLTRRKLVPALWSLYAARTLPEPFAIVAVARTQMSDDEFRRRLRSGPPGPGMAPHDHREAVRTRLRQRPRPQPAARRGLHRGPGLPDRP